MITFAPQRASILHSPCTTAANGSAKTEEAPLLETRVVADAAALKALADPIRLQMLELLAKDPSRTWTVKEIAAQMGQPVTRLYHHMKLLEATHLVIDAETRIVQEFVW